MAGYRGGKLHPEPLLAEFVVPLVRYRFRL